jgi:hypothetical protein
MQNLSVFSIRAFQLLLLLVCSWNLTSWFGSPHCNHLSHNADGDFLGQNRVDVNAHRRKHTIQLFLRDAFFDQILKQRALLEAAADHSDESSLGVDSPSQYLLIFEVSTGDDDKVRKLVGNNLAKRRLKAV